MSEETFATTLEKAWQLIKEYKRILIVMPAAASGDVVASGLALRRAIRTIGANADIIATEGASERYNFLPDFATMSSQFQNLDLIIRVNCKNTPVDKVSYNIVDNTLNLVVSPAQGGFRLEDVTPAFGKPNYDLIITLHTDALASLGEIVSAFPPLFKDNPIITIDYRASTTHFGLVNVVDTSCSSCSEVVYRLLEHNHVA
ncbi:MAG: hypothetical protein WC364_10410, partial [Eubacteriales bacterium]